MRLYKFHALFALAARIIMMTSSPSLGSEPTETAVRAASNSSVIGRPVSGKLSCRPPGGAGGFGTSLGRPVAPSGAGLGSHLRVARDKTPSRAALLMAMADRMVVESLGGFQVASWCPRMSPRPGAGPVSSRRQGACRHCCVFRPPGGCCCDHGVYRCPPSGHKPRLHWPTSGPPPRPPVALDP